jgi:hypothetical protein
MYANVSVLVSVLVLEKEQGLGLGLGLATSCLGLGLGLATACLGLGLGLAGQGLGLGLGLVKKCLGHITACFPSPFTLRARNLSFYIRARDLGRTCGCAVNITCSARVPGPTLFFFHAP